MAVGNIVWAEGRDRAGLQPFRVVEKSTVVKQGLWNPYTATGTIVVGGLAASVHSEWLLDGLLESVGHTELLPALYQVGKSFPNGTAGYTRTYMVLQGNSLYRHHVHI